MSKWKPLVRSDPTGWLLEGENPSVRYYTLTDILEKPRNDPETCTARSMIMQEGVVPKILAKQRRGGYWETAEDFYIRAKYKGTVLQLITLAELGAERNDERIRKASEFILENSQDRESGGFSYRSTPGEGGDHERVLPCLTGNMV